MKLSSIEHVTHCKHVARVYSRGQPCEISAICKKCCIKFTLPYQMGPPPQKKKIDPSISTFFFKWSIQKHQWQQHWFDGHSINLLWTFIASYCLNCLCLLRLSHYFTWQTFCSNSSLGFFICPEMRIFHNGSKASPSQIPFLDPLSWTPFLEIWPPKITEGGRFDPHWPISGIKTVGCWTDNLLFFLLVLFHQKILGTTFKMRIFIQT